ncbi:hypothetical protein JVU11DRAFT_6866 [Chiua virens]|nr:hypothetical protein JVU11DRAFT_6866 [Chiua virens]
MQLILSRNASFSHESGQVLYKTTLHKIKPNDDPMDMHDQFDTIGEIEWHFIGSSTFRLHGETMQSNEFLPSRGLLRWKRTFMGPDGRAYRWNMLINAVVLSRDDETRTEVARYYRGSLGIIGRKQKPRLEVDA